MTAEKIKKEAQWFAEQLELMSPQDRHDIKLLIAYTKLLREALPHEPKTKPA